MTKTLALILAVGILSAVEGPAWAGLFGFGKKKADKPDGPALPGMEKGAADPGDRPKMAQEEEQTREELGLEKDRPAEEQGEGGAPKASETETAVGQHASDGGMPDEVVIKAVGNNKLKVNKPSLSIEVDPYESIRDSLKPDQGLLLAESPLTVVWRRTHPELLRNERVVSPALTTFSERPGMVFSPKDQLQEVLGRKLEPREARNYQWSLTIADEEGKVFQHYEGAGSPPEEIVWSGENDQGEWIRAGRAYSPVYMFTDPGGTPYTRAGEPLRFKGVVHQERDGLHISLDSQSLFGKAKAAESVEKEGLPLLRAASDLVKRKYTGVPLRVEAYAGGKALAERQAQAVESYLEKELMLQAQDITSDALAVPYAEQRLELILVNR